MQVWAVANQKGGVGKTTTAVNLAGLLAARGHATLIMDLDPHGSATSWFGLDPDHIEGSAYSLFEAAIAPGHTRHARSAFGSLPSPASGRGNEGEGAQGETPDPARLVRATRIERLSLLPASNALATLERNLGARAGLGRVVAQALAQLGSRYEFALLDCPPVLGVLLVNALAACERLIIPVQTEFLALKGLERMQHTLLMISRSRGVPVPALIVPTLYDKRTRACVDTLEELRRRCGNSVWEGVIPLDTRAREASREGLPLAHYDPESRAAQAYAALLDRLLADAPQAAQQASEAAA
jgi:chromosome partitioning protein